VFRSRRTIAIFFGLLSVVAGSSFLLFSSESTALRNARRAVEHRDFADALSQFKTALGDTGGNSEALLLAARTARRASQFSEADRYLRRYRDASGSDPEIFAIERLLMGIQRGEVGQFSGGLRFCESHEGHPEVPYVLEAMAMGYRKLGNIVGTIIACERWLAIKQNAHDTAMAQTLLGHCQLTIGNVDEARSLARTAVELAPNLLEAQLLMAELLTGSEPESALKIWNSVLARQPNHIKARLGLVRCYRNLGDPKSAFQMLDELFRVQPNLPEALLERAKLHLDARRYPEAIQDAQTVLAHDTQSRTAMTILAQAFQSTGRATEAQEIRNQVKSIEDRLFQLIREQVAAGRLPAPTEGQGLNLPEKP
jgi:tetratricopeptide (TPR) repeat protein